jgi:hypothetical protein
MHLVVSSTSCGKGCSFIYVQNLIYISIHPSYGAAAQCRAMASLNFCPHTFIFCAVSLQSRHWSMLAVSSFTPSSHLLAGFSAGLLPVNLARRAFLGIRSRGSLYTWHAHCSLFNLMKVTRSTSLYSS